MYAWLSPEPEILMSRREARYYVFSLDSVFPVSIFILKDKKHASDVSWAPLEAKFVNRYYRTSDEYFEQNFVKLFTNFNEFFREFHEAVHRDERPFMLSTEIYRLTFYDVNLYLVRNRKIKPETEKDRESKLAELEAELQEGYWDEKDIPVLLVVSGFGKYKVPFDVSKDENGEPLNKFRLITENDALLLVKEALENSDNYFEYFSPFDERRNISPDGLVYRFLYLSSRFKEFLKTL